MRFSPNFLEIALSYFTIAKSITGRVPGTPLSLAQESVSDAITKIYQYGDWSFQRAITYANWLCPGNVANTGTYTTTPYQNTVLADGTATNALAVGLASSGVFLTTLQFRNPAYSIYNIVGMTSATTVGFLQILTSGSGQTPGTHIVNAVGDGAGAQASIIVDSNGTVTQTPVIVNPGTGYTEATFTLAVGGTPATFNALLNTILTLDRPWLEPLNGPGQNYMIYQAYFVAPVPDFMKFIEVRDTTNSAPLDFWTMTQAELAVRDPQRTEFADPSFVVAAGVDTRPGTSTPNYPMFELWPQQLSYIPYSFSYRRRGVVPQTYNDFVNTSPPYPLTEELVTWRALEVLYQFREAQKDKEMARGSGANYILLAQLAKKEYDDLLDDILAIDLNLNNEMFTRIPGRGKPLSSEPYSNQIGQLNIGGYDGRN